ncbi:hypothetical protein FOG17_02035 [Neisseria meningitidis]|nr:hypothetical protein [Neisseria meningitidis]
MLPHTGLFLLGKVALQMRIRRRLKTFQTAFLPFGKVVFYLFKAINEISAAASDARCRLSLSVRLPFILNAGG